MLALPHTTTSTCLTHFCRSLLWCCRYAYMALQKRGAWELVCTYSMHRYQGCTYILYVRYICTESEGVPFTVNNEKPVHKKAVRHSTTGDSPVCNVPPKISQTQPAHIVGIRNGNNSNCKLLLYRNKYHCLRGISSIPPFSSHERFVKSLFFNFWGVYKEWPQQHERDVYCK